MEHKFQNKHNKLQKTIALIEDEDTGNIKEMSYMLGIVEKEIKGHFIYLKKHNCPIKYDINRNTYYFPEGCKLKDFRQDKKDFKKGKN